MYYSQLLMLNQKNQIDGELIEIIDEYFGSLSINTRKTISASKMSNATEIPVEKCIEILNECAKKEIGLLDIKYSIHCPECGLSILQVNSFNEIPKELIVCYGCDEEVEIGPDDVDISYELKATPDFCPGQHSVTKEGVAYYAGRNADDSLAALLQNEKSINEHFFEPDNEQYSKLKELYKGIFLKGKTTDVGNKLEELIIYLFNLCPVLKAAGIRTDINQIDCFVRNKKYLPYGIFSNLGKHFYIECKNEGKKPSGSYISKLESIISDVNCHDNKEIKFGIIASKKEPPNTYLEHARIYYLTRGIIIISLCGKEINEIIENKVNLLELLERKIVEITDRVSTDLKKCGLFEA